MECVPFLIIPFQMSLLTQFGLCMTRTGKNPGSRMNQRMDRWMDQWMDRWTDQRTDVRTDRRTHLILRCKDASNNSAITFFFIFAKYGVSRSHKLISYENTAMSRGAGKYACIHRHTHTYTQLHICTHARRTIHKVQHDSYMQPRLARIY